MVNNIAEPDPQNQPIKYQTPGVLYSGPATPWLNTEGPVTLPTDDKESDLSQTVPETSYLQLEDSIHIPEGD